MDHIIQEASDIDWFFTNTNVIGFVASGGGELLGSVVENWEESRLLASFFKELPAKTDIIINRGLDKIINGKADERYLADFITMAQRGIFAYDKTILGNFSDLNYHLVASPVVPFDFNDLPGKLKKQLFKSNFPGLMDQTLNIGLIS